MIMSNDVCNFYTFNWESGKTWEFILNLVGNLPDAIKGLVSENSYTKSGSKLILLILFNIINLIC